jgi:NADH-quinone oxidoreductase subunit L
MNTMLNNIWLLPAIPLLGFLLLIISGKYFSKKGIAAVGIGSVALSAIYALFLGINFFTGKVSNLNFTCKLWNWINIDTFSTSISFVLDPLAIIFILVITVVGLLIHWYSAEYMEEDEGYSRFFAFMNLFIASMLILVMADNLLLMYLGWEGVGLCSYFLIGFYYKNPENNYAARKAFIVTRVGDTALLIGLLMLIKQFNTLNISTISSIVQSTAGTNSSIFTAISLLLLGGAVGKSAQLPLQVWLPDAMAGPSPVSALIHAATMVTAGVYLIARMHAIFILSPLAMHIVAAIGALTLIIAATSALFQYDIKRVLAYSTISQIGYMFLALGIGAWSAAIFHFMIHAFFKALLFLSAGAVIISLNHEQNMFKMGGLYKKMPVIFWTFLIAGASLSAFPFITGGFFSKDSIIWYSFASTNGNYLLWLIAAVGAFLTSLYTFRMIFITFFGEEKTSVQHLPGKTITVPLIILAILTTVGGYIQLPENMGNVHLFSSFVESALPVTTLKSSVPAEWIFQLISIVLSLGGIYIAYLLYYKQKPQFVESPVNNFFLQGWKFDQLYNTLFVTPFVWIANYIKDDALDQLLDDFGKFFKKIGKWLSFTVNGRIDWYLTSVVIGFIILVAFMLWI